MDEFEVWRELLGLVFPVWMKKLMRVELGKLRQRGKRVTVAVEVLDG